MSDTDQLYDIFIIYDRTDIRFVRRVDAHMKANGKSCWVTWDDLSASQDGQALLKAGILKSHTVAIALSPASAENAICNMLIQHAVNNSKQFVTLIVDENIEIDVHPAIAENPYIFFRDQDVMEDGIEQLLDLMDIDNHIRMHTELLVYANDWDARGRNAGLLLPQNRVDSARAWLTNGANREPRPSQLMVEYIHASRRQKSSRRWGISIYVVMGLVIIGLLFAVVSLLQSAQSSQSVAESRSTEAAIQASTSDANAQLVEAVVGSATAEAVIVAEFEQTATSALALADMAVNSASTADVMQQTAQADAQDAIDSAQVAQTAQADAESQLDIVSTESENAGTLSAQVLTSEFEAERLVETAQSAQNASLMMAQTATAVQITANEQANIAGTDVANLATVAFMATQQVATGTAVQSQSDNNAGTAIAAEQIAETEANGRSTAEAELQAINDTATQTFFTAQEVNSQALVFSAEQALNSGDIELALSLGIVASEFVDDSTQLYRVLSRAARVSPSFTLDDVSRIELSPSADEFALIPLTFDRVLIYDAPTRTVKFELTGHEDNIVTLRYSNDGQFLITASQDGAVIIWSTATGTPIHELSRHQGVVNAIAIHPDGQHIVTAGIRPMLVLWDINTGENLAEYFADRGEELLPNDLKFSADGQRLIGWSNPRGETVMSQWNGNTLDLLTRDSGGQVYVGYSDGLDVTWTGGRALPAYANDPNVGDLILWEMGTGQQKLRLDEGFSWTVLSGVDIAESTDSLVFITIHDDTALVGVQSSDGGQRVLFIDISDGTIQRTYQSEITARITSATILDDNRVLSTTRDNRLVTWSIADGGLLREIGMADRILQNVTVSADGQWAMVQASGGEVYLWSINSNTNGLTQTIQSAITGTALNQSGDRVLIAISGSATLQNTETQAGLVTLNNISYARMNRNGTHFATLDADNVILYDARTGIEQQRWSPPFDNAQIMVVSPSGDHIAMQTETGDLWLLRDDTTGAIGLTPANVNPAFGLTFSDDGDLLMTLHAENAILWETASATEIQRFPLGLSPELALTDRVTVAFGDDSSSALFFVQLDGNIAGLTEFDLNSTDVNRLTFVDVLRGKLSEDGETLLMTSSDNSIQIIDTASGDVLRRLVGHTDIVRDMIYQADNNQLVSASNDNTLIVWNVEDGTIAQQYRHPADVLKIDISESGEHILTVASDGMYRLWGSETLAQLTARITSTMTVRDLTCAEREQYDVLPLCQ